MALESTKRPMFKNYHRLAWYGLSDILTSLRYKDRPPCVYFNDCPNVGDQLNPYIFAKITGKHISHVRTNLLKHIRFCGSTLDSASSNSFVIGSGSISGKKISRKLRAERIYALRGHLSLALVRSNLREPGFICLLGDPGLLMKTLYSPIKIRTRYRLGIIPHFDDEKIVTQLLASQPRDDVSLISVSRNVESFVDAINRCEYILSSSLHGLILSDTYGIPNSLFSVNGGPLRSSYKYNDYYSTTDREDKATSSLVQLGSGSLCAAIDGLKFSCCIANYRYDLNALSEVLFQLLSEF